jgi:hypothetical protein
MLTFMSRSLRRWLDSARGCAPEFRLHALPQPDDFAAELSRLRGAWQRAQLRVAEADEACDIPIASAPQVGATAFVAGQGARIYSLDVFRTRGPQRPKAA